MTKLVSEDSDSKSNLAKENEEHNVKILAEQMLTRRSFQGIYLERRRVEDLNEYRDVVVINKTGNDDLLKDLSYVMKRLRDVYSDQKWIGITGPNVVGAPAAYCLWLKTWKEPFGEHKFIIKKVKFEDREICVSVKSLKLIDTNPATPLKDSDENVDNQNNRNVYQEELLPNINLNVDFDYTEIKQQLIVLVNSAYRLLTIRNMKMFLSVLVVMLIAAFNSLIKVIDWTGKFSLELIDKLTKLIEVCMPLLLALLEFIQKMFGATFLLIAMIWRSIIDNGRGPPIPVGNLMANQYRPTMSYPPQGYGKPMNPNQRFGNNQRPMGSPPPNYRF